MADSKFQIIDSPRLYVSYPLWQYSNGCLDAYAGYGSGGITTDEQAIKLINLDPNDTIQLDWTEYGTLNFAYGVVKKEFLTYNIPRGLWNFNYFMVLNHNLATCLVSPYIRQENSSFNAEDTYNISYSSIINKPSGVPAYDGFSIADLTEGPHSLEYPYIRFGLWKPDGGNDIAPVELGTFMFGKYFQFPHNVEVGTSLSYDYGIKSDKTMGGKSLNRKGWTKKRGWYNSMTGGTEAFGLRAAVGTTDYNLHRNDTSDSFRRASGKRTWKMSFNSLASKYVMNENPMMNSIKWDDGFDNYDVNADGITSTYNIDDGLDFYTDVVHKTNGGSIPMVLQVDKNDTSPYNFAIVKMTDYTIDQVAPLLYSISLTLVEQ